MRETRSKYTPIFDELLREYGLQTAAVYGRVWRYCQMKEGICYATVTRIAEGAGVSYSTTLRRLKTLCEDGYLEDLTPGLRNKPHRYKLAGKGPSSVRVTDEDELTPSSVRVTDEDELTPSSVRVTDEDELPSSVRVTDPSSVRVTDEETIRNNNNVVVGGLTEEEQKALDALLEIGFTPKSEAIRYAKRNPDQACLWVSFAKEEKSISNKPGYVRKRLDNGDDPPAAKPKKTLESLESIAPGGVFT